MVQANLIPRKRLRWIPAKYHAAHEYCFFLHDECVRALVEYEKARAHTVSFKFKSKMHATRFQELADATDPISAMRKLGYARQARKLVLSQVTMALVSDCLHHIYEALTCVERRKIVVAFNLLRKPLKDSLLMLSWMLGDEEGFYKAFTSGKPELLSQKRLGNTRKEILRQAIAKTQVGTIFDPDTLNEILYDRKSNNSFEPLFQRAVHLITVQHLEFRTEAENFNFIFKNYTDPDIDDGIYRWLPYIMLYLSHVIMELFERMRPMDQGTRTAFLVRSLNGYSLATGIGIEETLTELERALDRQICCPHCENPIKVTQHSGLRILMTDSFRCTHCHRVQPFPFSWIF
jgi:hypothetical protein